MTSPVSRRNLVYSTRIALEPLARSGFYESPDIMCGERRFPNMKTNERYPSSASIYTPTIYNLSRIIFSPESLSGLPTPCFSPTPLSPENGSTVAEIYYTGYWRGHRPFFRYPLANFHSAGGNLLAATHPSPAGDTCSLTQPSPCYCYCSVVLQP